MDPMEAKLECLKLAVDNDVSLARGADADAILAHATKWADWIIGDPVKSGPSFGTKGRDDPKTP